MAHVKSSACRESSGKTISRSCSLRQLMSPATARLHYMGGIRAAQVETFESDVVHTARPSEDPIYAGL